MGREEFVFQMKVPEIIVSELGYPRTIEYGSDILLTFDHVEEEKGGLPKLGDNILRVVEQGDCLYVQLALPVAEGPTR